MSDVREPMRDTIISSFGEILEAVFSPFEGLDLVVFYDVLGETIDYYSFRELFFTRLAAAHHGLIFDSTRARFEWLGLGNVEVFEIRTSTQDSITWTVSDDNFITVITQPGAIDEKLQAAIERAVELLREEAGY